MSFRTNCVYCVQHCILNRSTLNNLMVKVVMDLSIASYARILCGVLVSVYID